MNSFLSSLRLGLRSLLDLLFPHSCCLCGRRLALHEKHVCPWCVRQFKLNPDINWIINSRMAPMYSHRAVQRIGAYAIYRREGAVARLIQRLKYSGRYELGQWMGRLAATELKDTGLFDDVDVLVPIPLSWRRRLRRGYNQSELLAKGISEVTGIPVRTDILRRTVHNMSQTRVEYMQRYTNACDIFALRPRVSPDSLRGLHIMLVDDVMTTGTTMYSAIEVIDTIPEVSVSVFVWAWTRPQMSHLMPPATRS